MGSSVNLFVISSLSDPKPYIPCDSSCNNGLCDYTCGTCVCHPFYTGEHCDRPLSECGSHDSHMSSSYRVVLSVTRILLSTHAVIPCGDYYCFNEGTCEVDGSGMEYCQCPQEYNGEYCLYPSDCECILFYLSSYTAEQDGELLPSPHTHSLLLSQRRGL